MRNRNDSVQEIGSGKIKCRRCSSRDVVYSKLRGFDGIISAIFPCNVYRCLDCYHRFWSFEKIFANSARVWVWSIGLLIVLALILSVQFKKNQSKLSRKTEFIPKFDTQTATNESDLSLSKASDEPPLTSALSDTGINSNDTPEAFLDSAGAVVNQAELSDVKAQSETLNTVQEQSRQRLESAVVEDQQALSSLLKIDINYRIEGWRKAWESGIADDYLKFYSNNFKPNRDLAFDAWATQRKSRITPNKQIKLLLSEFDVTFLDQNMRAIALFTQAYSSPTYSERSRKKLVLVNENGEWNIVSETSMSQ